MTEKVPEIERLAKDVYAYDRPAREWRKGERKDILVPLEPVEVVWTDTGENTDVTPDHDYEIDVLFAQRIIIQVLTTHASNTSTDFDVNVMANVGGQTWDTVPYAERNIGDAEIKTFLVEPGPAKIRLRGDQNSSGKTGYVTARVLVVK